MFARSYVNLVEALQREGVVEEVAREEARYAAFSLLQAQDEGSAAVKYDPVLGPCPTCGRG